MILVCRPCLYYTCLQTTIVHIYSFRFFFAHDTEHYFVPRQLLHTCCCPAHYSSRIACGTRQKCWSRLLHTLYRQHCGGPHTSYSLLGRSTSTPLPFLASRLLSHTKPHNTRFELIYYGMWIQNRRYNKQYDRRAVTVPYAKSRVHAAGALPACCSVLTLPDD